MKHVIALYSFLAAARAVSLEAHAAYAETRLDVCRAVVREMHIEIHKHKLRKNGEDDIYETVPAICLAIVQNYTLWQTPPPAATLWSLTKRTVPLDDAAEEREPDINEIMHLRTLKDVCELFTEEWQQEMSELMYHGVLKRTPEEIMSSFCDNNPQMAKVPPPPPPPRKRRQSASPSASGKSSGSGNKASGGGSSSSKKSSSVADKVSGTPDMDELLQKYDTDGSISNLLEMEREHPEAMLEAEDLAAVERGAAQIRCDVCVAAAKVAFARAKKDRALRDEEKLGRLVANVCYGTPPDRIEQEFPKYPGNPPLWGEHYTVEKVQPDALPAGSVVDTWRMRRLPKGAKIEEKGGKEYNELVIKHAMISRACKQAVLERDEFAGDDDDGADLAQSLYAHATSSGGNVARDYCRAFCEQQKVEDATREKSEL